MGIIEGIQLFFMVGDRASGTNGYYWERQKNPIPTGLLILAALVVVIAVWLAFKK